MSRDVIGISEQVLEVEVLIQFGFYGQKIGINHEIPHNLIDKNSIRSKVVTSSTSKMRQLYQNL